MKATHFNFGPNGLEESKNIVLPDYCILYGFGPGMNDYKAVVLPESYNNYGCQSAIVLSEDEPYIKTFERHIRPLSKKFGIGLYYDDNFKTLSYEEVAHYIVKALQIEKEEQEAKEEYERLKALNIERGKKIFKENMPSDTIGVIVAELKVNESDSMTDYYGYSVAEKVILAFTTKKRHDFNELRKAAANCNIEAINKYSIKPQKPDDAPEWWTPEDEHRENYSGGEGYYLGSNRYDGWSISKYTYINFDNCPDFWEIAGKENGFFAYKSDKKENKPENIEKSPVEPGKIQIIEYSDKSIAVIGDTRTIKDKLKELGGKFNFRLSCGPGWIFSKSKLEQLKEALTK